MQVVLYQDAEMTKECDFKGYTRIEHAPDEKQELVWAINQPKAQTVFGYKVGKFIKKFNRPVKLEAPMKLAVVIDQHRVRQYNKEI